jgi:hypothetical protein
MLDRQGEAWQEAGRLRPTAIVTSGEVFRHPISSRRDVAIGASCRWLSREPGSMFAVVESERYPGERRYLGFQ